jgi:hypothetical protein
MARTSNFDESIETLVWRVAPMLDEVDLENHEPLAIDMDDPLGRNRKKQPERIQKLGALCDQKKITVREHNRLVFLEREST